MDIFQRVLKQEGLPVPEAEYKFCKDRKWKFDYAYPKIKLAIEQEGGVHSGGRHTRGVGFIGDMEKYNKGVLLGWRILRYTPGQMLKEGVDDIKEIMK